MPAFDSQPTRSPVTTRQSFARVAHFGADLPPAIADQLWRDPFALVGQGEQLRSRGARHTVRLTLSGAPYVLKHYVEPTRRHTLKQLVLTSRASRTWSFANRLADCGVATPRPVACIENRWGPLRRDSFLMYPYVEGRTLRTCFATEAKQSPAIYERLWREVHQMWQRLLELRVSLEDTHTGNFIVCPAGKIWLIDLDKSRFHRTQLAAGRLQSRGWKQLSKSINAAYTS
jgi:hypothetical protein